MKKFNPELLKEALKRHNALVEYDFYQEKKELPEYKDLILGDVDEADDQEKPGDLKPDTDNDANAAADKVGADLGVDKDSEGGDEGDTLSGEIPEPQPDATAEPAPAPEEEPEPASDDVEVDVTSLVKGSEEAKQAANAATHNSELLLHKFDNLEARLNKMDSVSAKIEDLEKEIIKRNPTPVEKLEMRSLDSFPYSQKLTDYWGDKEGPYDVMGNEKKKKEYVLTKDAIDSDYSDANIKKSFSIKPDEYEEEDVNDKDYNEENT